MFRNQFPALEDGKIATVPFLEAAREIVNVVDKLGKLFFPVKNDINGNIEKLYKVYRTDTGKNHFLHDLILNEQSEGGNFATDALLWLTRALHFMEIFLEKVFESANTEPCNENLNEELSHAYSETLKQFHGWFNQKAFLLICRLCPTRTDFFTSLGTTNDDSVLLNDLNIFLRSLRINRIEINRFYAVHKLENNNVV